MPEATATQSQIRAAVASDQAREAETTVLLPAQFFGHFFRGVIAALKQSIEYVDHEGKGLAEKRLHVLAIGSEATADEHRRIVLDEEDLAGASASLTGVCDLYRRITSDQLEEVDGKLRICGPAPAIREAAELMARDVLPAVLDSILCYTPIDEYAEKETPGWIVALEWATKVARGEVV